MSQIISENLTLGYEGREVIKNLNFSVNSGDYLCIVGENGSGKSTLIKSILGLIKPISGSISTGDGLIAKEIGFLPQQTIVQKDFPASVKEVVLSGCLSKMGFKPFYGKSEIKIANENMEKLGISHLSNSCYRELSGGQQQRVLLARALCATKKMLLLDEPVTGLDPKSSMEMYDVVKNLNKQDKITIVMVSHDIKTAIKNASHILHVSYEPLFFGKKEDYLKSDIGKSFFCNIGGTSND